ncbi:MAG: flagellar motor protein MotB [SAR324 cluster bacterium]|nr:flagellar motor protein MotB [SAR324 cluster bacterium]MCZ6628499.1 flagellar motor protein MotB [SAR324 cluster bacterium]MCZ6647285.1 flagellar motor protein MotB [SAR324 cluster bacterium]
MTEEGSQGQSFEDRAREAARAEAAEKGPPKREKRADDGPDPDAWMVTFSDLLVLLMTFFVLIFASQDPIKEKIFEAFGQSPGVFAMFRTSFFEEISAVKKQDISQDRVEVFLDETGSVNITVKQEDQGLVISLPSGATFAPGRSVLLTQARTRIAKLAALLRFTIHDIRVEGHADDRELGGAAAGAGWDLSVERAHAVLQELRRGQIDQKRLSVSGYGPTRPKFSNVSRLGRQRNRRVEIVILNRRESP